MSRDSETLLTLYQWSTADFSISLLSFISLLRHFFIATSPNFSSSSHAKFLNRKEKEKKKKKERSNSFISAFEFWYGFFLFFCDSRKKMVGKRRKEKWEKIVRLLSFSLMVFLTKNLSYGLSERETETALSENPAAMDLLTQALFKRFSNFSSIFSKDILREFGYCIEDV